jgi:hypothetical protein
VESPTRRFVIPSGAVMSTIIRASQVGSDPIPSNFTAPDGAGKPRADEKYAKSWLPAGNQGKGYRSGLFYRQKYTTKLTL